MEIDGSGALPLPTDVELNEYNCDWDRMCIGMTGVLFSVGRVGWLGTTVAAKLSNKSPDRGDHLNGIDTLRTPPTHTPNDLVIHANNPACWNLGVNHAMGNARVPAKSAINWRKSCLRTITDFAGRVCVCGAYVVEYAHIITYACARLMSGCIRVANLLWRPCVLWFGNICRTYSTLVQNYHSAHFNNLNLITFWGYFIHVYYLQSLKLWTSYNAH